MRGSLTVVAWIGLLSGLASLAACNGGGGDTAPPAVAPPAVQVNRLSIVVAGVPAGSPADVAVSSAGSTQNVSASTTLENLAPGSYTVAANAVVAGGSLFVPQLATQTVAIAAGSTTNVTVTYAIVRLALQAVASGLDTPLYATTPSGDPRLFVVERPGRIRVVKNGALLATPFLDLGTRIGAAGEGGLLSVAFDPNYATNGFLYVYFTDVAQNIAVERFHVSANADVADPAPLRILSIAHPVNTNHYGGLLMFDAEGLLYIGTGDGGGGGDPPGNAQNLDVLLGKLLRIDVRNASAGQPYAIPPDNPFATATGRRPEIWAFGLRNPWRYAFDRTTARLYVADVGQDRREEIDVVPATSGGLNFGWNVVEGTLCFPSDPCNKSGTVVPVLEYGHDASGGCSITGGFVYRGSALPAIAGRYVYSDFCSGFLRSLAFVNGAATEQLQWPIANVGSVLSFGQDAAGELYMLSANGTMYRIVGG